MPFWQSALAEDPETICRTARAGGIDFTIAGITHPDFTGAFPGFRTSIWTPIDFVEAVFRATARSLRWTIASLARSERSLEVRPRIAPTPD
jgi:hypothetical protein